MIISGDFIALSCDKDFVGFEDRDNPLVIWFNIRNISCLSCYKDHYRLCIDDCHMIQITSEAASELIHLMRKERDDKVHEFFNNLTSEQKEKAKEYFDEKKSEESE